MQTRKEYLASLNPPLAKIGKGRISAEGHAAIDEAVAKGMQFSDLRVTDTDKPMKSVEVAKKNAVEEFFGATPDRLYDGGWYVLEGKKKVVISGTEVCRNCKNSLDWHSCNLPVIPNIYSGAMVPVMR